MKYQLQKNFSKDPPPKILFFLAPANNKNPNCIQLFLFSFVQVPECAHCIYVINANTYFNFYFYFMLAKGEKHKA